MDAEYLLALSIPVAHMEKLAELRNKFSELLDDQDFDYISSELQKPNIFQILGVTRTEIRHSNFLSWLLDANANHGLGNQVVMRFLRSVLSDQRVEEIDESEVEELDYNTMRVYREWHHIDIMLEFTDLIVCIENKVDSGEHTDQLTRYRKLVKARFPDHKRIAFVYLTPTGAASAKESKSYVEYSYQQLVNILERVMTIYRPRLMPLIISYLEDYTTTIKREILENDDLNILAAKLYRNHREVLDFLFQYRPDRAAEFAGHFYKMLEEKKMVKASPNKGFARFLPPALDEIIPRTGTDYPLKESFLFEIDFYWPKQDQQKKLTFRTIIAPGNEEVREILKEAISKIPKAKIPAGQKFVVHFLDSYSFNLEELQQQTPDELAKSIEKIWQSTSETVTSVTEAILERKSELMALRIKLEKPQPSSGATVAISL
jgi:hypothetical protein